MELKDITIHQMMTYNAHQYADSLAIEYEENKLTWYELNKITDYLAEMYLDMGISKGSHVGIFGTNSPNWVMTYLALAKIGAISVLINFNYKEQKLREVIHYTQIEYLCYGDGYKEQDFHQLIEALKKHRIPRIKRYIPMELLRQEKWYMVPSKPYVYKNDDKNLMEYKKQVETENVLSMILTSGTTASPKGILLTHYQMLNIAREASEQMHWKQSDKICLCLALFHCFGLATGLLASIANGSAICLLSCFRSKQVLDAIQNNKCTIVNGVPSMFLAIMENPAFEMFDLSSLQSGIVAGSGLRSQDYRKIKKAFRMEHLQQSFGQTEASPSITFSGYADAIELKEKSVGRVISHVELRIAKKHSNQALPPFEEGEIQIKGYNVMQYGYFRKKAETKRAFTKDGWLRTGDLGHLDEEGNLYVTGRLKEIIIRCGENIAPKEIEEVMLSFPYIRDVKVFGVPAKIVQEEIAACILCNEGYQEEDLRNYLAQRLPHYKIPKYIECLEEFPLNTNGKLDIKEMKDRVVKGMNKEEIQ
jgi:fatty-acyl-CoA synthase